MCFCFPSILIVMTDCEYMKQTPNNHIKLHNSCVQIPRSQRDTLPPFSGLKYVDSETGLFSFFAPSHWVQWLLSYNLPILKRSILSHHSISHLQQKTNESLTRAMFSNSCSFLHSGLNLVPFCALSLGSTDHLLITYLYNNQSYFWTYTLQPWIWKQHVPLKCQHLSTKLFDIIIQKTTDTISTLVFDLWSNGSCSQTMPCKAIPPAHAQQLTWWIF
jgi:hypothetical protein